MPELTDLLSFALILMMFAMGLGLKPRDFIGVLAEPRVALAAFLGQLLILPVLAVSISWGLGLSPAVSAGLLLVALCPSGSTSNFFTKLGNGNSALSVSLTALISLVTVFSLPIVLLNASAWLGYQSPVVSLSVIDTIQDIALHTLLPVMLGMGLNTLTPSLSARIEPWAVRVSGWFFFVVIAVLWYQNWQGIVGSFVASGVASLLMLLLAITCGYLLALLVGADERDRYTVMLEVGVQNGALAFFIALNIMGDVALLGPATVYSVAMVLFALPLLVYRRMKMRTV